MMRFQITAAVLTLETQGSAELTIAFSPSKHPRPHSWVPRISPAGNHSGFRPIAFEVIDRVSDRNGLQHPIKSILIFAIYWIEVLAGRKIVMEIFIVKPFQVIL